MSKYTADTLFSYLKTAMPCVSQSKGLTAFVLAHNYKTIYNTLEDYINLRNKIVMEYGERGEDGEYYITDEEKLEKANKELDDYAHIEYEVDIIKIPEIKAIDSGLSASQLMSLNWMIKPSSADDIRSILGLDESDSTLEAEPSEEKPHHYDPKEPIDDDRFL